MIRNETLNNYKYSYRVPIKREYFGELLVEQLRWMIWVDALKRLLHSKNERVFRVGAPEGALVFAK
jgi:hypothetical protein